jgi:leader peptidase (prepilin peptidase)/N-methyltransferase
VTPALAVIAGLYGLVIGSFLNVVIHRVPLRRSVVRPPSACPGCGVRIAGRDNVPILSWVVLRGRCRGCAMRIPLRYPLVEALTGGLFVLVTLRFGLSPTLPAMLVFVAGLTALAFCDLYGLVIPKRIVYPTAALVSIALLAAAAGTGSWHRLAVAAACGAGGFVVFLAIHLVSPRAMGFGDVRLAPLISGTLGWLGVGYAVVGFLMANLLGSVIGLALIAAGRNSRRTALPYGVFLALGAVVTIPLGGLVHYPV